MHLDYCFEALRRVKMCLADTTPYLIMDDANATLGKKAHLSAHHKCRNFDRLKKSMIDLQLAAPQRNQFRPKGWVPAKKVGHGHGHGYGER